MRPDVLAEAGRDEGGHLPVHRPGFRVLVFRSLLERRHQIPNGGDIVSDEKRALARQARVELIQATLDAVSDVAALQVAAYLPKVLRDTGMGGNEFVLCREPQARDVPQYRLHRYPWIALAQDFGRQCRAIRFGHE